MLDALRRSVGSWVVKAFIGVIMLSFAVWGVSDVFRGYRGTEIARVGETEIPSEVFRDAIQREIQSISQQIGTYLTLDQARAFGLDRQVLGRLVSEAALDEEARRSGLGMSDSAVADSIRSDPTFRGPAGQFDRAAFNQFLRNTGYSEGMFVADQRRRLMRYVIGEAVGGSPVAPEILAAAVNRYQNEARTADFIRVTADLLEEVPEPGEEELVEFFEENRSDFRAPEYRSVAMIPLQPEDLVEQIEVSEEDARDYHQARIGDFEVAEQRTIEQIAFSSLDDAQAARAEIAEGRAFEEIADEQGVSQADRVLGALTRDDIVDDAIAEAAFALEPGEVSEPVEGVFAPTLLRVTEVEGGERADFEAIEEDVRRQLALERAQGEILDFYDIVEDDRAGGRTLAEIAERHGLPYREIERIDSQGRDALGEPIAELPPADQLLPEIFETDVGFEADPLQIGTEGYLWFEVRDIEPARDREFEEARSDVHEAWTTARIRQQVNARAQEIADRLHNGMALDEVAEDLEIEVGSVGPLTRGDTSGAFGSAATGRLFTTPEGGVAVAEAEDPLERVVFRVSEVAAPEYTPGQNEDQLQRIASGLADDLTGQYIAQLQERAGVSINQGALNRAMGEAEEEF